MMTKEGIQRAHPYHPLSLLMGTALSLAMILVREFQAKSRATTNERVEPANQWAYNLFWVISMTIDPNPRRIRPMMRRLYWVVFAD
jgi:hypothetical protein